MANIERVIQQLKIDEGFSTNAYWDHDHYTYGYGTKAPDGSATITEPEAIILLRERTIQSGKEFERLFGTVEMSEVRQEAIINMLFNLGLKKFSEFKKLSLAIYDEDWGHAAYEAFDSLWYQQLRKRGLSSIERSERIVWELLTGER